MTGQINPTLSASYARVDSHYRHLFNLDGIKAVIHLSTANLIEIWVGNNNQQSGNCVRGFDVTQLWGLADTLATLHFSILANGTLGDLFVGGTAAGPAAVTPQPPSMDVSLVTCDPVMLEAPLYWGASGNAGYNDNFAGTFSGFGL